MTNMLTLPLLLLNSFAVPAIPSAEWRLTGHSCTNPAHVVTRQEADSNSMIDNGIFDMRYHLDSENIGHVSVRMDMFVALCVGRGSLRVDYPADGQIHITTGALAWETRVTDPTWNTSGCRARGGESDEVVDYVFTETGFDFLRPVAEGDCGTSVEHWKRVER